MCVCSMVMGYAFVCVCVCVGVGGVLESAVVMEVDVPSHT